VRARNDDTMPYETLVATIAGRDPAAGEIVYSCHLDHEKPGANDNASGCAANLEIARTLKLLIDAKRIPPPARTIRFIWPSEMTGTIAYLTKYPEIAGRIRAAIHLDMVGGGAETKVGHGILESGAERSREQILDGALAIGLHLAGAGPCKVRVADDRAVGRRPLLPLLAGPAEPAVLVLIEDMERFVAQLGEFRATGQRLRWGVGKNLGRVIAPGDDIGGKIPGERRLPERGEDAGGWRDRGHRGRLVLGHHRVIPHPKER